MHKQFSYATYAIINKHRQQNHSITMLCNSCKYNNLVRSCTNNVTKHITNISIASKTTTAIKSIGNATSNYSLIASNYANNNRNPQSIVHCKSVYSQFIRLMAHREQVNRDKEHMKKKKEKQSAKNKSVSAESSNLPQPAQNKINEFEAKSNNIISKFEGELNEIHLGSRINSGMFDNLKIRLSDGKSHNINELANITPRNAQTLVVTVFDDINTQTIEKALKESDRSNSNLTIQAETTNIITVNIPKTTKETRDQLLKQITQKANPHKENLRGFRQLSLQSSKSMNLSEDQNRQYKDAIQQVLDHTINHIDKLIKQKQEEINKA